MTRVDFYVLAAMDLIDRQRFACRLAQRAVGTGQGVHLHVDSDASMQALDTLLWSYPPERFIPHECLEASTLERTQKRPQAPISIGRDVPLDCDGVLINLATSVPEFFASFHRVAEIIVAANKEQGRNHYKLYRHRGYPLHHHDIDDWEA